MKTIRFGSTDVEVSALCLGTMLFGSRDDHDISYRLLDQYVDAGGTFLDTANIYARWIEGHSGGDSETLLGEWMRERGNRDKLFIASKVGFEYPGVERGLKASQIEEECNKSLKRMGIETIDLFYAHVDDLDTPLEESLEAFNKLVQAGKVRFIGASNYSAWRLAEAQSTSETNNWAAYCCVQQRYSYARPKPGTSVAPQALANEDLLDYCRYHNFPLLPYSALLGGAYSRADRNLPDDYQGPDSDVRLQTLNAVAEEIGASANQVVLAWMMAHDFPVIPLIAASSEAQLTENLQTLEITLTQDQFNRLDGAHA